MQRAYVTFSRQGGAACKSEVIRRKQEVPVIIVCLKLVRAAKLGRKRVHPLHNSTLCAPDRARHRLKHDLFLLSPLSRTQKDMRESRLERRLILDINSRACKRYSAVVYTGLALRNPRRRQFYRREALGTPVILKVKQDVRRDTCLRVRANS